MFTEEKVSRTEAGSKTVPFGKYRGYTLSQVIQMTGGEQYLFSLLKERSVGLPLKQAIQVFLEGDDDPGFGE